jgi:hypothetical protein
MPVSGWENPTYFERIVENLSRALGTTANAAVYNPGVTENNFLAVYFNLLNTNQTTTRTVQVGVDYGALGTLHTHWFYEPIPPASQIGWRGPNIITADDDVLAWQDVGTDVTMLFCVIAPVQYAQGGP